jgi:hypothetical protein
MVDVDTPMMQCTKPVQDIQTIISRACFPEQSLRRVSTSALIKFALIMVCSHIRHAMSRTFRTRRACVEYCHLDTKEL